MKIGISTACFYPLITEKALENVLKMGFKEIEIFFNCSYELDISFLRILKDMIDSYGARVVSVHPYTAAMESMIIFTDYMRRYDEGKKLYSKYAQAAHYLGSDMIVIHGDKSRVLPDEAYYDRFHDLDILCRENGARLIQENVNVFRSHDPLFIRKMREYLGDEVGFTFDIKQCIRAGCDPFDMLNAMGKNVVHVHVNDNDDNNTCLLPGEGKMDYIRLKKELDKLSYSGSWILEVYSRNFAKSEQLRQSAQYLEGLLG